MELLFAALPGVITTCLLAWVLLKTNERHADERKAHRGEVANAARALLEQSLTHQADIAALIQSQREQMNELLTAHRIEVADLCQRIQAPEIAVAEHVGQNTLRDPASVDLENDEVLAEIQRRENDLRLLEESIHARAEELAAER